MQELTENYRRMIEMKVKQQEQPSEEVISSEVQAVYQGFYEKLKEKHLTEEEKAYLEQEHPELYEMICSLEREIAACQSKLLLCGTKEEVRQVKEAYEADFLRGLGLTENNQAIPLIKRLEYTMFKDTKRAFIEDAIDGFIESDAYKKLPGEEWNKEAEAAEEDEEAKLQRARHARAKARYEGVRSLTEEKDVSGAEIQVPFDVKG